MKRIVSGIIGAALAVPVWYATKTSSETPPVVPVVEEAVAEKFSFVGKDIFIVEKFSENDVGLAVSINFSHEGHCKVYTNTGVEGREIYQALLAKRWDTIYDFKYDDEIIVPFVDIEAPMISYKDFISTFLDALSKLERNEFTITGHPAIMSYLKSALKNPVSKSIEAPPIEAPPIEAPPIEKAPPVIEEDIPTIKSVPKPAPVVKKPVVKKKSSPPRRKPTPTRRSKPP